MTTDKAIAGKDIDRIAPDSLRLQGATTGASPHSATVVATSKAGKKTSETVCSLTEIA